MSSIGVTLVQGCRKQILIGQARFFDRFRFLYMKVILGIKKILEMFMKWLHNYTQSL